MVEVELVITVMESCTPQLTQQGRTEHPLSVSTAQGSRGAATEKAEKKKKNYLWSLYSGFKKLQAINE